jgi:sterol desaturase/sphingolipid hydroxylase (fatty acid hydroxylase superfamily)
MISFFAGMFSWTFAEYALHNWVGHKMKGKVDFSKEHLAHHRDLAYFTPTLKKILLASAVAPIVGAFVALPLGLGVAIPFTVGFIAMYTVYEWLHRRIHTHAPLNAYGRWARRHHLYHHHGNPKLNHGVTSPIWDVVFGTLHRPEVVRVPRRKQETWMTDAPGAPRFMTDYELFGRG